MKLGVVRWFGEGEFNSDGYRVLWRQEKKNGVALIFDEKVAKCVER